MTDTTLPSPELPQDPESLRNEPVPESAAEAATESAPEGSPDAGSEVAPESSVASEATQPPKSKKPLVITAAALVGLLVVGAAITVPIVLANQAKEREALERAAAAIAAEKARKNQIPQAVATCSVDSEDYTLLDDNNAIEFARAAKLFGGASAEEVFCVLDELGAPESIEIKIGQTRSLDGTREAEWEGWKAQWTYHPDDGLNLLAERTKN